MRFVAIDVETANPRLSSICQIGVVTFEDGKEVDSDARLVNPNDYFADINVSIHGITEEMVKDAPPFPALHSWLCERTSGEIIACHTHFDRIALSQACGHHSLTPMVCAWLDTAMVARRTWEQFSKKGYGLSNLARQFDIEFEHHDALHDARTAGLILLKAMEQTGLRAEEWTSRCRKPLSPEANRPIRREGDGDGPLVGESIVFTGSLSMIRRDAADLAHEAGAAVIPQVTKKATLLVVGDQDIDKLNGQEKSSKHRKAEKLIEAGQAIRILTEADFLRICEA